MLYQPNALRKQRAPMASSLPGFRRATRRFARVSLQCSQYRCLPRTVTQPDLFKEASLKHTRAFETSTRQASSATSGTIASETGSSSPLSVWGKSIGQNADKAKPGFFPKTSEKSVAYWLLGSAASVFGIVVFGGLTRLTESGYPTLFRNDWQGAYYSKPKYYRMEACDGQPTANKRRGLEV